MTNAQERALHAYPASCRITERACYEMGYEQAMKDREEKMKSLLFDAIDGTIFTSTSPHNLFVKTEDWNKYLEQFENGQKVKVIILPVNNPNE